MTPFKGQTEKAGHFLQPTTRAIGHRVIALLLRSRFVHRTEREDARRRYCLRLEAAVQSNSIQLGTAKEVSDSQLPRNGSFNELVGFFGRDQPRFPLHNNSVVFRESLNSLKRTRPT
jgi:hypothetical protein